MKRVLRWAAMALGGVAALALIALAVVSVLVEVERQKTYAVPRSDISVPSDSAAVAVGARLARIRGCTGCHGANLEGRILVEQFGAGRLVAPNLTRVAAEYTDAKLERAIRHGVRPNGRSVLGMPSPMFYHLTDADLGAIIAFARSMPRVPDTLPETSVGPLFRVLWVVDGYDPEARKIDHGQPRLPADPARAEAYGRYLAMTSCSECHGQDLRGQPGRNPSLAVAAGYSDDQFREFLRTGIALGGRELRLMSNVARDRFAHFTDAEIRALRAYLKTLASSDTTRSGG